MPNDPSFPVCAAAHREKLIAEVEALLKVGPPPQEGETRFTDAAMAIIRDI